MPDMLDRTAMLPQMSQIRDLGTRLERMGFNFIVCDGSGQVVFSSEGGKFTSDCKAAAAVCSGAARTTDEWSRESEVRQIEDRYLVVAIRLDDGSSDDVDSCHVAVIDLGTNQPAQTPEVRSAVTEMLSLFASNLHDQFKATQQIEMISTELSQVYEELVLLHKLSSNMKLTQSHCNYLQMACDSLTDIVPVEGVAILLEKANDSEKQLALAAGSGLIDIDHQVTAVLHARLEQEIAKGKEALLDSDVDTPFRYEWDPSIRSIIAVPLFGTEKSGPGASETHPSKPNIIGVMVAINRLGRADFDSIDAKLFNSVANGCAVFVENGRLFNDLKELFIGSLKALTNSIDAKDQYTRGHSERVAFISKWIAERLSEHEPLEQEQIHKVYLAGLLHDVGKMGIDEAVLQKKGKLTDQEFACIKKHPSIGAGILGDIKQMRQIVPGVLCHHERIDGKGYPNGLTGDQIPLLGKIVGLADSFDAMTSKRTYREALSVEQALDEIRRGLGTQFDEKLGRIFIESDVYHLWDMLQQGLKDVYGTEDSEQYGAIAVGALVQ